jgi:predicted metal-dependent hydrolase
MTARPSAARLDPHVRDALIKGIAEFNSWRFYDCHETLEDIWREAGSKGALRQAQGDRDIGFANFYQGIIKAAAGFHHVIRGNYRGAVNLLEDTFRLLGPYRPAALGVDVDRLLADIGRARDALEAPGADRIAEFDRSLIPAIQFGPEATGAS